MSNYKRVPEPKSEESYQSLKNSLWENIRQLPNAKDNTIVKVRKSRIVEQLKEMLDERYRQGYHEALSKVHGEEDRQPKKEKV